MRQPPSRPSAVSLLALASLAMGVAGACGRESAATPAPAYDAAAHRAAWDKWKAERAEFVSTPGRPISYTGLTWLRPGANPIGSARGNTVVLPGRDVPARVGVLVRAGDTVRFEPAAGTHATVDSQAAVAGPLRTDADTAKGASRVLVGSAGFRIVKRVDSIGVRSWDAEHPALKAAPTLAYFPLDTAWRQVATFVPATPPRRVPIMTELGVPEEHVIIGTTRARIGDSTYALTTFSGTGPTDVHIVFADASSGDETYGFRFVHAPLDTIAKTVTLDFNFAYNPDCAFSPYTTCPLPPRANHIKAKILAGEKKFAHDSL
jgi:uncharacterized protein (DUF1684 family)